MKKIIRLTESDLTRIVKRVIKENEEENIEEPYYTKSYGDPLEFYKNGMMQFALSVNLDDVNEVGWLRRKLDALTKEAEGKLSEEELRKLMSYRNNEIEPYISGEEEDYDDELIREDDDDDDDDDDGGYYTFDFGGPKDLTALISGISDLIDNSEDVNDFEMKLEEFTNDNLKDFNNLTDNEKNRLDRFINSVMTRHDFGRTYRG